MQVSAHMRLGRLVRAGTHTCVRVGGSVLMCPCWCAHVNVWCAHVNVHMLVCACERDRSAKQLCALRVPDVNARV